MRYYSPLILALCFWLSGSSFASAQDKAPRPAKTKPNVIIIFADDLGYGDLTCYGHPTIRTPNLDRMAAEGMRFTSFYVAASVCTPSRAGLLTGRYPVRSGMTSSKRRVLFPDSGGGLPASEITIAEVLKSIGYATACIGKWHLGHLPQFLPTTQGFDYYYGIPYSNDMDRIANTPKGRNIFWEPKIEYWNVPIMRNTKVIERPADQHTITKRYTEETIKFIKKNKGNPFFIYMAHNMPHIPLFASKNFQGTSKRGLYGDVVEEIDWSVGQILATLKEEGIDDNTIVIFTSDNGPWLVFGTHGGSAGLLREGKGSTWEGGMRVPGIMRWPGQIKGGQVTSEMASTLDLLPTIAKIAGGKTPTDRVIDGYDLSPLLFNKGPSPRKSMMFYRGTELFAVRHGPHKAHFITQPGYGGGKKEVHETPLVFNVEIDPSEKQNVAKDNAKVIEEIRKLAAEQAKTVEEVVNQLEIRGQQKPKDSKKKQPSLQEMETRLLSNPSEFRSERPHRTTAAVLSRQQN